MKSKHKIISFDWDGVITVRGEILKQIAWDNLAKKENPRFVAALAQSRKKFSGGRGSRYDIIQETLLESGKAVADSSLQEIIRDYAARYQSEVMNLMVSDIRPGTRDILSDLSNKSTLYVNSATAEDGLRVAAEKLDLARFFKKIYGYPTNGSHRSKADILRLIMSKEGLILPGEILHVGDGLNDLFAAKEIGCDFIGVANGDNGWLVAGIEGYPVVADLTALKKFV